MFFKVVKITNNLEDYPECAEDTAAYPELVEEVTDEMDLFVIYPDGEWLKADEFFYVEDVRVFKKIK